MIEGRGTGITRIQDWLTRWTLARKSNLGAMHRRKLLISSRRGSVDVIKLASTVLRASLVASKSHSEDERSENRKVDRYKGKESKSKMTIAPVIVRNVKHLAEYFGWTHYLRYPVDSMRRNRLIVTIEYLGKDTAYDLPSIADGALRELSFRRCTVVDVNECVTLRRYGRCISHSYRYDPRKTNDRAEKTILACADAVNCLRAKGVR